jgi:NAD-dependent dihydropyrimidine dehydrogenase PreA subunit
LESLSLNASNGDFLAGHPPGCSETFHMAYFSIDTDRCLNYNYKKADCRRCREICPRQCWDQNDNPLVERCDSCGLCQSVCPVDAIAVEGQSFAAWTEMLEAADKTLHLSCEKFGSGPWPCLGFLNARDLVALAWRRNDQPPQDLFLYTGHCYECRPTVADHIEAETAKANRFLARFNAGLILPGDAPPPSYRDSKTIDRRSFFRSLVSTGLETTRNVLWPEAEIRPLAKVAWRTGLLQGRTAEILTLIQEVFPTLTISADCIACGFCAKICPTQAISAEESAVSLTLSHQPLGCTECGLCVEHCPGNAIRIEPAGEATARVLITKDFPRCNECGKVFKPAGQQLTCFDCLMKGRQSVFGPGPEI